MWLVCHVCLRTTRIIVPWMKPCPARHSCSPPPRFPPWPGRKSLLEARVARLTAPQAHLGMFGVRRDRATHNRTWPTPSNTNHAFHIDGPPCGPESVFGGVPPSPPLQLTSNYTVIWEIRGYAYPFYLLADYPKSLHTIYGAGSFYHHSNYMMTSTAESMADAFCY